MSIYRYTLSDDHAIKEADITIDGITVLAGENGCGKSTLSRWLYYLVNGAQRFEDIAIKLYEFTIDQLIEEQSRVVTEMRYLVQKMSQKKNSITFKRPKRSNSSTLSPREKKIQDIQDKFEEFIYNTGDLLSEYLSTSKKDESCKRVIKYLGVDSFAEECDNPKKIALHYITINIDRLKYETESLSAILANRTLKNFLAYVGLEFNERDDIPSNIQLYEDGVDLIGDNRVSSLFNLRQAIYIDTPMALTNDSENNIFWKELRDLIKQPSKELDISEKKILRRLTKIMHGEVKMVKDDSPFTTYELRFVSDDGKVNIEIDKAATGFKTFIYLQRLLENGYLGSNCLLLIDEPEAHLHPQWIVEYARLLVLLHKELGQKIMLATHNPDMVAAIRSIAEREQVLDKTNFYISEPSGQSNTYCYKALGTDISEIFTSFNIALDRIQAYGTDNL